MDEKSFAEILAYYLKQGAPQDQQMLIALLREAQELDGGALTPELLEKIADRCDVRENILRALIRRIPSLRTAAQPHRLEMCSTCAKARTLAAFVEKEYGNHSGFSFRMTPCMKNCRSGPSIRWDGQLYSHADEALLRKLIGEKK